MKNTFLTCMLVLTIFLNACASASSTPEGAQEVSVTSTLDLCSTELLPIEAQKVNDLMREFDDYSALASSTPQNQLINIIPDLQRVLRQAEDTKVPPCLIELKKLQLTHMNLVIQTLMAFLNSGDAQVISEGIAKSREFHTKYNIELARLLGLTFTIPPTSIPSPATPSANQAPVAVAITAVNPGPDVVNMRTQPDINAPEAGTLSPQASAVVLGKSADNLWIKIEIPNQAGQTAWVFAELVQLSVPIDQISVTTP